MKNMPMDLLRTFVTIADVGGYTLAGELLGRSQPAISLQIKRLEALLGHKLITRQGLSVQLTPPGHALLQPARQILAINDDTLAHFSAKPISGHLHLGIPSEFASSLLPKIISRFARTYPSIALEVTCALSKHLLAEKKKPYDLVLALHDQPKHPDELNPSSAGETTHCTMIKDEELVWVTSAVQQTCRDNAPLPLVVAPEGCIYRERMIKVLNKDKIPWRIVCTIPDLSGIKAAIETGLGVTVLAKSTVPNELKSIRHQDNLPPLGKTNISLTINTTSHPKALQRLADYLRVHLMG